MKKRSKVALTRALTLLYCALMLADTAGCASKEKESSQTPTSQQNSEQTKDSEAKGKVYDFDALVNDKWVASAKEEAQKVNYNVYNKITESNLLIQERLIDIMKNTDISSLSEDSDLYKALCVYNQIMDENWQETMAKDAVREKLKIFESINTLDDLYELHKNPYYSAFDYGMMRAVTHQNGCSLNTIAPCTLSYCDLTAEQMDALKDLLLYLGYDAERADEIAANTKEIDTRNSDYYKNLNGNFETFSYAQEDLDNAGVTVPILDILKSKGALGKREFFLTYGNYPEFLNKYYTPENAPKIRDYMTASAAIAFSRFLKEDGYKTYNMFHSGSTHTDYSEQLALTMSTAANDAITKEYNSRYINAKTLENTKSLLEEVRTTMRDVISDADWLTVHGKELAKRKVLRQNYYFAENTYTDDLSEITLTDDPLDNYIALRTSHMRFMDGQLQNEDDDLSLYGKNMLDTNAFYVNDRNGIYIESGELDADPHDEELSFEEELGKIGTLVAHEISHGYDPSGSRFDFEGYEDPWMTDEEYAAYCDKTKKISEFFDGMDAGYGCKIDGERVCNEAFADLMGMECCLRILDKMEDADYDAFFRAYAKSQAGYYDEDGMKMQVADTHLPAKLRINYTLGQFDRFYETYDIDPESPYYVPEDKRLSAF